MAERKLPGRRNPHMPSVGDEKQRQDLVAKRRLGQTELQVDAGSIGTTNATKLKNLGTFDYAHIRVLLPRDLKGSGIFHASRGNSTPESYFLMRRSSDGYISATGMFKSTFPWASAAEETAEKTYIKKLPGVSKEEVAGNVWIPPQLALDLAEDYQIRDWLEVLLDNAPIGSDEKKAVNIKSPPAFHASTASPSSPARNTRARTPLSPPPTFASLKAPKNASPTMNSPRKRALRSASPVKMAPPEKEAKTPRKIAEPKSRTKRGRAAASASVEPEDTAAPTTKSRKVSRTTKKEAEQVEPSESSEPSEDMVKVSIQTATESSPNGEAEIETTRVEIETPARHPTLALPDDAQAYLDSAKKALQEARSLKEAHQGSVSARGRKRKAVDISRDEQDEAADAQPAAEAGDAEPIADEPSQPLVEDELPAPKRRRVQEIERRKDRIKRRATVGIMAGLAVGATLPYVLGTFLGL